MENWLKLEGDVCAVTGALGGMGTEICREFARNGANVVLLDLDEDKVKAAAAGLSEEFGIHAEGYRMDATDEQSVQDAVDATIRDFGHVEVLVNTAGILRFAPMEDLPLSDWEATIKVNLTGYFITSQRFGREMIKAGRGRLVHISTAASHSPETFSGAYSSTKAGFVKTPMSADFYSDPEVERSRSRLIATRRIGEVSDIANAVMFLASPRSDFTTGAEIKVDGGFSNMMGGLGVILGPTGGFLWGFLIGMVAATAIVRIEHLPQAVCDTLSRGILLLISYALGTVQLMIVGSLTLPAALAAAVVPFVVPDAIKMAVGVVVARAVARALPQGARHVSDR